MKYRNIKINMFLNVCKGVLTVIFPLITFPYVTRVLGVENLGKVNFANSVINYFLLLAGLGISTYAVREGAQYRDNKEKMSQFASEIFTFNLISTLISYALLVLCIILVEKLNNYRLLLIISSLSILFQTLGMEWICSIFEDYVYLTLRYIVFQLVSIICLFLFVKKSSDYINYALIYMFASSGAYILTFFRTKKFCSVGIIFSNSIFRHLKSVLTFFATTLAISIYVSSDTLILGLISGDYHVGLYTVSVRIYTILKTILVSMITVTLPRISAYTNNSDKTNELNSTVKETYDTVLTFLMPLITGVLMVSTNIVLLFAGSQYLDSVVSLRILTIAMIFCVLGYFWAQCVLYPFRLEKVVLIWTIISAVVNIILNVFLIPIWNQNAAAFTTLISEFITASVFIYYGKKYVILNKSHAIFYKVILGCFSIVAVCSITHLIGLTLVPELLIDIIVSVIIYFVIEIITNNPAIHSIFDLIRKIKIL